MQSSDVRLNVENCAAKDFDIQGAARKCDIEEENVTKVLFVNSVGLPIHFSGMVIRTICTFSFDADPSDWVFITSMLCRLHVQCGRSVTYH